jgi:serine-type D-ala-D-ala carboxypeptidase
LSEGIRDDMKVEEGAKPELVKETASGKKTTAKHSKWLSLDHFLILIPILILVIILSIEKQSRERRKKEAQKRYNKE